MSARNKQCQNLFMMHFGFTWSCLQYRCENVAWFICRASVFTATCFSNVAVMGSLDVRLSVRLSVRNVGDS